MYNDPTSGTDTLEFIEIYNKGDANINLSGYSLSGVNFTFPADLLGPGEYTVIAKDSGVFYSFFGVQAHEWTSGALNNMGETITLYDDLSNIVDIVNYDNTVDWPEADGTGPSIVLCDPDANNNDAANWYASMNYADTIDNGTPVYASPGIKDDHCFTDIAS
jgi:hypothetical protein